jgi:outer membrane murein-binding lipoprotein Lpp
MPIHLSKAYKIGNIFWINCMNKEKQKMKRQSLTIVAVLLASLALASCGIPQEDYDQVVSDLTAAQAEITKLETDLATARNENGNLQNELDAVVAEYEGLQTECNDLNGKLTEVMAGYESLQTEYDDLNAILEETGSAIASAYVYHSIVIELLGPAVTGDALTGSETINAVGDLVKEAGDEGLQEKFDAWSANASNRSLAYELLWYAQVKLEEIVFEMGG